MTAVTFSASGSTLDASSPLPTVHNNTYNAVALGANLTLTAAQLVNGYVFNADGAGFSILMPNPSLVVAYITSIGQTPAVGMRFPPLLLRDAAGGGTLTLAQSADGNFTVAGDATGLVLTGEPGVVYSVLTNVGAGTEAAKGFLVKAS